jgi:ABC-type transport system involved in cytochrome bd biosynthesis fused ATPase/permease subunit
VADLSLTRGEGAMLLEGANGSGKSTLMLSLLGLLTHVCGELTVDGTPLGKLDAAKWRAHIAYLPQRPYVPAQGTIRDALNFLDPKLADAQMRGVLDRLELEVELDADVTALSAGQRQRLAIARVLLRDADVFLLDEPDQNLDRRGLAIVSDIVRELARTRCVIVAAHDTELLAIEGHHIKLDHGRIVDDEVKAPASAGNRRSQASA